MGRLGVLVTHAPGPDLVTSAPLTTPPRRKKLYSSMLSLPEVSRILAHIWKLNSSLWRSKSVRQVYLGDGMAGGREGGWRRQETQHECWLSKDHTITEPDMQEGPQSAPKLNLPETAKRTGTWGVHQ